jgi:Kdo2-lipid IVA lauroyltransferase/acyltransferase
MMRWFWRRIGYAATQFGFTAGCLAMRVLPRKWIFFLSDVLASIAFVLFRRFRTRSSTNVRLALGDNLDSAETGAIVRGSLRNFFRSCVEVVGALESSIEAFCSEIPISGREHLDVALAKGNGVIVLSAHLSNFFLIGTRLAGAGYTTHVLVNPPKDRDFAQLMDDYRWQVRQRTIHARPRREALNQLHLVLRRNELAVVIADEYRKGNGIPVPLFGRTVQARRGPATLALRTGAAVVPVCMVRQSDDSLKLIIEPELDLVRSGETKVAIRENTLRLTQWLERTVCKYPDQWNWMNIRWSENQESSLVAKERRFEGSDFVVRGH